MDVIPAVLRERLGDDGCAEILQLVELAKDLGVHFVNPTALRARLGEEGCTALIELLNQAVGVAGRPTVACATWSGA